jgi:hypothetical protein
MISISASSYSKKPESWDSEAGIANVLEKCFGIKDGVTVADPNWGEKACEVESIGRNDDLAYLYFSENEDTPVMNWIRSKGIPIQWTKKEIQALAEGSSGDGAEVRASLMTHAKVYTGKNSLRPCQKVCLSRCIVNNFLKYSNKVETRMLAHGMTRQIYAKSRGNCVVYARMAIDIAKQLGVELDFKVVKAASISEDGREDQGHSVPIFQYQGEDLVADPIVGNTHCTFYRLLKDESVNGSMEQSKSSSAKPSKTPPPASKDDE